LQAGASGYVLKDAEAEAVVCSVIAVSLGEQVISAGLAGPAFNGSSPKRSSQEPHDRLTAREMEILELLAAGVTNKQIARNLDIADKTVRNHLSHIYEKLQISDRSQALLYAMKRGMVQV
jgi:DNA-binding NarL/FixJ family response regulator